MNGYRKECVISPLFKMLEATFELFVPLVVARIIDVGIANSDKGYIVKMCLLMALLGAIGLSCTMVAQYFAAKASVGFVTKIKHSLFEHITSLSHTEIDTLGTSTLITRMTSDMNQVQSGVNLTLRLFMRSPFIVFGAMIMAFTIDVRSAVVFTVAIPLLSIVVFGIMLSTIPLYKKVQTGLDKVLGITRENLSGVRVIRAFGKEKEETKAFKNSTEILNKSQKFAGAISAIMNPATFVIINIAIAVLIWQGAIQVNVGNLTQGQVIALYNYMSQILVELIKLANLIINVTKSVACANRIEAVFEIKPSIVSGNEKTSAPVSDFNKKSEFAVEFKNVSLRYSGSSVNSLDDIDFSVKKGETVGIIGGTGSGKTSLINMIGRFYDAHDGEVLVDGMNVKEYNLENLREKIGIVPQKAVLFRGSLRDNMKWGNENATDEEILNAIDIAQASDVLKSKGDGLDCCVEQGGKNFSGGQRQRFTIARALVRKPEILILDDSASALDYQTDANLRHAIAKIDYNPTVFIVSQRTSSIQNADKIIVLDDGKIVGMGKHADLIENCVVYNEIYNSQFRKESV
jgi:ABC-type multidrug transport system fused ATPase/permease subunit